MFPLIYQAAPPQTTSPQPASHSIFRVRFKQEKGVQYAVPNVAFCLSTGVNIEMLGRRALWEVGLNYGHGTGHGVGNYFGVHECTTATRVLKLSVQ